MKRIIVTLAILSSVFLVGCIKKEPTSKDYSKPNSEEKKPNTRIYCFDGVKYFAVWNNNAFNEPYLTGAKIDPVTLKPETCSN